MKRGEELPSVSMFIRDKIRGNKFLEANENDSTSIQNPWDTAKAVLKGDHSRRIFPSRNKKTLK